MTKVFYFLSVLFLIGCASYKPYWYDNGKDYVEDGAYRIVDKNGCIGYANKRGKVIIKPQFAAAFPFENGYAKVAYTAISKEVEGSGGEYHYWESDSWFFIDKTGKVVADTSSVKK